MILDVLTLAVSVLALLVGTVTLLNNKKGVANRILFFLSAFVGLWVFLLFLRYANFPHFLVSLSKEWNFFLAKLGYAVSTVVAFCVLLLSFYFPREIKKGALAKVILFASLIFIETLIWSNQIVCNMDPLGGRWVIRYCGGNVFFAIYFFAFFAWAFINFIRNHRQVDYFEQLQIRYLLLEIFLAFLVLSVTNLILPQFFGIYGGYQLRAGPMASVFFPLLAAYAIVKHQLLEIKVIVRKTAISAITIGLISGAIVGISFLGNWFAANFPGLSAWTIPLLAGVAAFAIGNIILRKNKELESMKYEFITVAAHKFRTPLTEIKWATKALMDIEKDNAKTKLLQQIASSNNNIISLADYLMSSVETEGKDYSYKKQSIDFKEALAEPLKNLKQQAGGKNIALEINLPGEPVITKIDKERVSSVAQVLFDNAITYTKSKITVNIKKENGWVTLSVADDGIGISKKEQEMIFSRFYRTHEAQLTQTEGAGVGLYIARSIVERHGGKIGIESKGEGAGSEFWFKLRAM